MKLFEIIILIFCFIYSSKSQESNQWSIIRYISDDYPGISYFELNNGSIGYIYIDTLQKREEQKERLKLLQNSKVYPFIQKIQGFYFMIYVILILVLSMKKE